MKKSPYVFFHNIGLYGLKVCSDVVVMVKIWKRYGTFGKYLSVTELINSFYREIIHVTMRCPINFSIKKQQQQTRHRFLPEIIQGTFTIGRGYSSIFPNNPLKTHAHKNIFLVGV